MSAQLGARQAELVDLIALEQQMQVEMDRLAQAQREKSEFLGQQKEDSGSLREEVEWLTQKIANLEHENKQYQKCLSAKTAELERVKRSVEDSRSLADRTKEMKLELEGEFEELQRRSAEKEVEAAERIRSLTQQLRHSNKQQAEQLRVFGVRLEGVFRRLPSVIRRQFGTSQGSSTSESSLKGWLEGIEQFVGQAQPEKEAVAQHLAVIHSIGRDQLQREGLIGCLARVQQQRQQEVAEQHELQLKLAESASTVSSLRSQLSQTQKQLNTARQEAPPKTPPLASLHPSPSLQKQQSSEIDNSK